jgi:hypothetical protein
MQPWKQKRYWIQATKLLVILMPVMALYAMGATRGLVLVCSSDSISGVWCKFGFIAYVVVTIAIARVFYVRLKPKD